MCQLQQLSKLKASPCIATTIQTITTPPLPPPSPISPTPPPPPQLPPPQPPRTTTTPTRPTPATPPIQYQKAILPQKIPKLSPLLCYESWCSQLTSFHKSNLKQYFNKIILNQISNKLLTLDYLDYSTKSFKMHNKKML